MPSYSFFCKLDDKSNKCHLIGHSTVKSTTLEDLCFCAIKWKIRVSGYNKRKSIFGFIFGWLRLHNFHLILWQTSVSKKCLGIMLEQIWSWFKPKKRMRICRWRKQLKEFLFVPCSWRPNNHHEELPYPQMGGIFLS